MMVTVGVLVEIMMVVGVRDPAVGVGADMPVRVRAAPDRRVRDDQRSGYSLEAVMHRHAPARLP